MAESAAVPRSVAELISLIPQDIVKDREDPAALSRRLAAFFDGVESGAIAAGSPWVETVSSRVKRLCLVSSVSRAVASLILHGEGEEPPNRPVEKEEGDNTYSNDGDTTHTNWIDPKAILSMCKLVTPDIPEALVNGVTDWVAREYMRSLPFESDTGAAAATPSEARRRLANGWGKVFTGAVLNYPFIDLCEGAVEGLVETYLAEGEGSFSSDQVALSLEQAIMAGQKDHDSGVESPLLYEGDLAPTAHAVSEEVAKRLVPLFESGLAEDMAPHAKQLALECMLAHFSARDLGDV